MRIWSASDLSAIPANNPPSAPITSPPSVFWIPSIPISRCPAWARSSKCSGVGYRCAGL